MTMNIRKIALTAGLLLSVLTTSAQGQSSAYQPGVTQDGVSYFLPKTMVTVTVTAQNADNNTVMQRKFTGIPVKRNMITEFSGSFFEHENSFSFKAETEWGGVIEQSY